MSPHPEHFDRSLFLENLVNQAMLDVDAPRVGAGKVSYQFLETRWCSERIPAQDLQKRFGLCA